MLPPLDESVLERHPDFAAVYSTLTTVILNPDGTTKTSTEHDPVREDLDAHRLHHARCHILAAALSSSSSPSDAKPRARALSLSSRREPPVTAPPALPSAAQDLLLLLPSLLTTPLPAATLTQLLAAPPLADLDALLPLLAPTLSHTLHTTALSLARLAAPHRPSISSLPASLAALSASLAAAQTALAEHRLRAAGSATAVLTARAQALGRLVRALEAKHGAVARSAENRAAEMALEAQRLEAETRLGLGRVRRDVYSREALAALANYARHLRDARVRLDEAVRSRKMELAEYGVGVAGQEGKAAALKELAKEYHEVGRRMDDVESDLERLRR